MSPLEPSREKAKIERSVERLFHRTERIAWTDEQRREVRRKILELAIVLHGIGS